MLGGILGLALVVFILIILSLFELRSSSVAVVIIAGVGALNVMLGLWPTWIVIILAVLAGVMVWREVASGGGD